MPGRSGGAKPGWSRDDGVRSGGSFAGRVLAWGCSRAIVRIRTPEKKDGPLTSESLEPKAHGVADAARQTTQAQTPQPRRAASQSYEPRAQHATQHRTPDMTWPQPAQTAAPASATSAAPAPPATSTAPTAAHKRPRQSNVELLRIVAMLMIVLHHIMMDGAMSQSNIGVVVGGFTEPHFYKRLLTFHIASTWGPVGNAVFILISGYFLVGKGRKVNIGKSASKLLLQLLFATVVLVVASFAVFRAPDGRGSFAAMVTMLDFNNIAWFIGYYFLVVLVGFLFLNEMLDRFTERQYLVFLLALLGVVSFQWSGALLEALAFGLRTFGGGVLLYAIGGYMRRFDTFRRIRAWVWWAVIIMVNALVVVSCYNSTQTHIKDWTQNPTGQPFQHQIDIYPNYSLWIIILGVAMFELFLRLRIPTSRVINYLASATFMVYLIHSNSFFYSIWGRVHWIDLLAASPKAFVLKWFEWALLTFACGVAAYAVYQLLSAILRLMRPLFLRDPGRHAGAGAVSVGAGGVSVGAGAPAGADAAGAGAGAGADA